MKVRSSASSAFFCAGPENKILSSRVTLSTQNPTRRSQTSRPVVTAVRRRITICDLQRGILRGYTLRARVDLPLQKSPLQLGWIRDVDVVIGHVLARQGQVFVPVVALPSFQSALAVNIRIVQWGSTRTIHAPVVIHASGAVQRIFVRGATRRI